MDGQKPQIYEVWDFGSDDIMHEVHPTARVDISAGVVVEFLSDSLTESGRRITILRKISMNGSV